MDNTTHAEPLISGGSDCALTGRVTVEWSPDARPLTLCTAPLRRVRNIYARGFYLELSSSCPDREVLPRGYKRRHLDRVSHIVSSFWE
jgi:hypothetical protein